MDQTGIINKNLKDQKKESGPFFGLADIRAADGKTTRIRLEKALAASESRRRELETGGWEVENSRTALLNILEDIDQEKKLAEEEQNKTLAIITNLSDGLLFFDKSDRLVLVNPTAESFFKIKKEDLFGKTLAEMKEFVAIKPMVEFLEVAKKPVAGDEFILREGLVLQITRAEVAQKQEKIGVLIVFHDISREKLVERIKTEFVSLAAHQLRTPLSAIKWTLKMLLNEDLGKINDEQRDFINKTYSSNERMINLINDLLNVTRIEEGRYLYKLSPASFDELVEGAVHNIKEKAERREIKIECLKTDKNLMVNVDKEKIIMAIQNLIENAVNYSLPSNTVTIGYECDKINLTFSVKDGGIGIPKNQQSRIFGKFFRGDNAVKMETEGSGLGLFLTKNIIESHDGKVWFDSEENKGTTFHFTLPIYK